MKAAWPRSSTSGADRVHAPRQRVGLGDDPRDGQGDGGERAAIAARIAPGRGDGDLLAEAAGGRRRQLDDRGGVLGPGAEAAESRQAAIGDRRTRGGHGEAAAEQVGQARGAVEHLEIGGEHARLLQHGAKVGQSHFTTAHIIA